VSGKYVLNEVEKILDVLNQNKILDKSSGILLENVNTVERILTDNDVGMCVIL